MQARHNDATDRVDRLIQEVDWAGMGRNADSEPLAWPNEADGPDEKSKNGNRSVGLSGSAGDGSGQEGNGCAAGVMGERFGEVFEQAAWSSPGFVDT